MKIFPGVETSDTWKIHWEGWKEDSRYQRKISSEFEKRATNYLLKNWKNENGTKVNGASETCGTTDRHTCNGRGKERLEKIFEKIMSENSANLIENINLHMHVAQQTQLG